MSDRQKGVLSALEMQFPFATTRVNIDARTWLDKINPIHWSRHAFDQSIKCDHVTNI
ncbi:hypothetical protein ACOSQ2_003511 [Xanthoceras sorbifolium]